MPRFRPRLLLVAVVAAMVLLPVDSAAIDRGPVPTDVPDGAFAARLGPIDVPAVRPGDERRGSSASLGAVKHRSGLIAVVTLLALTPLGRRSTLVLVSSGRPRLAWWSPRVGRAPPALPLLVV